MPRRDALGSPARTRRPRTRAQPNGVAQGGEKRLDEDRRRSEAHSEHRGWHYAIAPSWTKTGSPGSANPMIISPDGRILGAPALDLLTSRAPTSGLLRHAELPGSRRYRTRGRSTLMLGGGPETATRAGIPVEGLWTGPSTKWSAPTKPQMKPRGAMLASMPLIRLSTSWMAGSDPHHRCVGSRSAGAGMEP